MKFGRNKDVPAEVTSAGLSDWYSGLDDRDKVRVGRYLAKCDHSSAPVFLLSVMRQAIEDHNYSLVSLLYKCSEGVKMSDMESFDIREEAILGYYGDEKYDEALELCDNNLNMIGRVMQEILARNNGALPESIICRNYKINILIGVRFDYDEGEKAMAQYLKDGLISKEDYDYRMQSLKVFKLQKAFDGIYTVKVKE